MGPVSAITSRTVLQSQFFKSSTFFLKVFERVFLEDPVGLQKAVHLNAGETEHIA